MKKRVFVVILTSVLVLSLLPGVFAQTPDYVCPDDQVILRLSADTNAHAETYDSTNYAATGVEICYDDYFDTPHPVSGTEHTTGAEVVYLSSATNAHLRSTVFGGPGSYPITIQYEGFSSCNAVPIATSCGSNQAAILRLVDNTNAHAETIDGAGDYPYKICCTPVNTAHTPVPICGNNNVETGEECDGTDLGGNCAAIGQTGLASGCNALCELQGCGAAAPVPTLVNAEWHDLNGVIPPQPGYVNETYRLFVETADIPAGETITFDVYDDDPGPINDQMAIGLTSTVDALGVAEYDLFITDDMMDAALPEGTTVVEFFFEATHATAGTITSDPIPFNILPTEDPNNDPPIVDIAGVVHRGIYFVNTDIDFNDGVSDDLDGTIEAWEWTIEDVTGQQATIEESSESFTQNFATAGERVVTLKVTDDDGKSAEMQIAILIIASPGAFAFIEQPAHHAIVELFDADGSGGLEYVLDYSAQDSFVVDTNPDPFGGPCDFIIQCLAGTNCPTTTENVPTGCPGPPEPIIDNSASTFGHTTFSWDFVGTDTRSGIGDAFASGSIDYTASGASNALNDKEITLEIIYDNAGTGVNVQSGEVTRTYTLGQCLNNGQLFYEQDSQTFIPTEGDINSDVACAGNDGDIGTGDDCCGPSRTCTIDGCVPNPVINSCDDYTDAINCNNDTNKIVTIDPLWNENNCASDDRECFCAWDASGAGECEFKFRNNDPTGDPTCTDWSCSYDSVQSECINGFMIITVDATFDQGNCWSGTPPAAGDAGISCLSTTLQNVPCGQFNIELPFFAYTQFITALASIFLVYAAYAWYSHKKR